MIISSHLHIADYVMKSMGQFIDIKLDKKSFRYGNIKPDIDADFYKYSHNFGGTIDLVLQLIDELHNEDIYGKKFSEKLGMVNHFVADYFCSYHAYNYLFKRGIVEHIFYETRLHYKMISKYSSSKFNQVIDFDMDSFTSVKHILRFFSNAYYGSKRSLDNDICYALKATVAITSFVVNSCIRAYDEANVA